MRIVDYKKIIDKYYPEFGDAGVCKAPASPLAMLPPEGPATSEAPSALRELLLKHSRQVADRCLLICDRHPELRIDRQFVEEAAMLHDIGIRWCSAPSIFCYGTEPYLRHGQIGAELLRREGWERHARVAERHTGTGLPGFEPEELEEMVVCYADKFFSKSHPDRVLSVVQAAQSLERFGHKGVERFLDWASMFE